MRDQPSADSIVSDNARARLEQFAGLVQRWSPAINLVSPKDLPRLWERHILDSLQLWDLAPSQRGSWLDLGSGGGFPGAVIAIMASAHAANMQVTLVESDRRKAAFLRTVSRETGCPFTVIDERAEILPPMSADILSARALAPLNGLLGHAWRHLSHHGIALFPKGARHPEEWALAERHWRFESEILPSRTDNDAVVYRIRKVERV